MTRARASPRPVVTLGGGVHGAGARFGRLAAKVPARRVPEAVHRLVAEELAGEAEVSRGERLA